MKTNIVCAMESEREQPSSFFKCYVMYNVEGKNEKENIHHSSTKKKINFYPSS
jgi:hypothetical protein